MAKKSIDSGAAVARQTLNILKSESLLNLTDKAGKHLLYSNLQTETQRVWSGYMVTYQHFGRYYQNFVYNRPRGKYITIMTNEG
jgi:hypothetical protein